MMLPAVMLAACLGPWAAEPDPSALVRDLASADPAKRDDAFNALADLGPRALPALYETRKAPDAGVSKIVSDLVGSIERQRLLRPTRVSLDFEERPLHEVIEAIGERSGFLLEGADDGGAAARSRPISLRSDEPVPFWEALDRLGDAGGVRHSPGALFLRDGRGTRTRLVRAPGPTVPASYVGPLRINLVRVSRHREVVPASPPKEPRIVDQCEADLQVFAEPGLSIRVNGPVLVDEAVDELGQDLRGERAPATHNPISPPQFDQRELGFIQVQAPLKMPEAPGRRMARFSGRVPVVIVARTGGPVVVVRLDGNRETTASAAGLSVTASSVRADESGTTMTIAIRGEGAQDASPQLLPRAVPIGDYQPPYRIENHLQILDAAGRICGWNPADRGRREGETMIYSIKVSGGIAQAGAPAEVRYYGVIGSSYRAAFEFTDVPLP
jgi:hypothetical protein